MQLRVARRRYEQFVMEGVGERCATLAEVAQRFDLDVATVSKGVRRLAYQAEVSEEVQERIAHLFERLKAD